MFADLYQWSGAPPAIYTIERFSFPSETIMVSELGAQDDPTTPIRAALKVVVPDDEINDLYGARRSFRHFQRESLGFFDGHSKAMRKQEFHVGIAPADAWFCLDRTAMSACATW